MPFDNATPSLPQPTPPDLAPEDEELSDYWGHLNGDDLGAAVISRAKSWKEWARDNGLMRGWYLKCAYFHGEFRNNPTIPHLNIMQQFGSQGEFQFLSLNHLRSILKTILGSVIQNPPNYKARATNTDANSKEAAALYDGVLAYYVRDQRLRQKLNKAAEIGTVVDQAYSMVEWDFFASTPQQPGGGIWQGDIAVKTLYPWDVYFDYTKGAWSDLDWVIVRDWVPKQKVLAQFPEFASDIKGSKSRADVIMTNRDTEGATRYEIYQSSELSEDIQVFKLFYRDCPWMPKGRFAMFLDSGKLIYESPAGLVYPRLPVERFVCDEVVDMPMLGVSPINDLIGLNEGVNTVVSSIVSNAVNYGNQFIAAPTGSELNPKTLETGHRLIEYNPQPGAQPPQGLNFTQIPESLFKWLEEMISYMEQIPGVSNVSRGETPGANSTGSSLLFSASQTGQNSGNITENFNQFSADTMTNLLHTLRVFARTPRTIQIMGQTVASQEIVMTDALADFDEVVVDMDNPILATPQGKAAAAQQVMQYGGATPQQFLQVLSSGNLDAVEDPAREASYYLDLENKWLMQGKQVTVDPLDDHEAHILKHTQLKNTPWLRLPDMAQELGRTDAPMIAQAINAHIMMHMQSLSQNHANTAAQQTPGAPPPKPSHALGVNGPAPPAAGVGVNNPAQGEAVAAGTSLPSQPSPPQPQGQ